MAEAVVANASFRAALEKVLDGERVVLATAIARLRIACSLLAAVVVIRSVIAHGMGHFATSLLALSVHLVCAIGIWWLLKTGRLVKSAGWVVPLFDVPIIGVAQVIQTPNIPVPWMGMVNTPAMMIAFMVLSMMSLSRVVIVLTTVIGLGPILYRAHFTGLSEAALGMTLMAYLGIGGALIAVVSRMRGLVHTSRAQDLLGKYVLGRRVGLGGMAEVFEATYSPEGGFERRVAVKRILPSFANQQVAMAMFRQEAEVGAMLAHPGVVQVLDFGTHQGTSFLAMEFIDGVSLKDLINHYRAMNKLMPMAVVTHIAWQITEALDYIHTRVSHTGRQLNLIHRDLNPPNIMLTNIGDSKLADFGIALVADQERMTAAGIMRGKLMYAAPEQVTGAGVFDGRADLFAFGLTLHECLTGNRVFRADTEVEVMRLVLEAPILAPSLFRPDVPKQLDAIVMGLLERDLKDRIPSASELRRRLMELPRELLDVQAGRRELAAAVLEAREAGPSAESLPQSPTGATASDATKTTVAQPISRVF